MHLHLFSLKSPLDVLYLMRGVFVLHHLGDIYGSGPTNNFNLLKAHFYANF